MCALASRKPLRELVAKSARLGVARTPARTRHSMALDAQPVDRAEEREQLNRLARELAERSGAPLWDEDE